MVVAHDYLSQRGGAERVVLEMARAYPGATVLTSMYVPERTYPEFRDLTVRSLGLERIPAIRRDLRRALPVIGALFRREVVDADLLLCSSSGFAHQLRGRGRKVVYCHNPPRWLYQWEDYAVGLGASERLAFRLMRSRLLRGDQEGARSACGYIANSANVARRIASAYGIVAPVVHPPRGLGPDGAYEVVPDVAPGFLLTVGRPRGYKRTDLLKEAVAGMPEQTLVTVGGGPSDGWPPNVVQLTDVSDAQLRWLYRSARALLACSREDFGLTPVEAFAFGVPVGATREGGYLETCVEGRTGLWLDADSMSALRASIRKLVEHDWDSAAITRHGQRWQSSSFAREFRRVVDDLSSDPLGRPNAQ
ncbi:glycosyltransferase family 4 protein [Blastococcus sp. TF02-8]|nr:glycosyltransferase family 4 protein [Blastococcus sp. TF02-8]